MPQGLKDLKAGRIGLRTARLLLGLHEDVCVAGVPQNHRCIHRRVQSGIQNTKVDRIAPDLQCDLIHGIGRRHYLQTLLDTKTRHARHDGVAARVWIRLVNHLELRTVESRVARFIRQVPAQHIARPKGRIDERVGVKLHRIDDTGTRNNLLRDHREGAIRNVVHPKRLLRCRSRLDVHRIKSDRR